MATLLVSRAEANLRAMQVNDVLALERLDQVSVSPDSKLVAVVILRGALPGEIFGRGTYEIDPSRGDLWIVDRETGEARNLISGRANAAGAWCAAWSPDGRHLAFLSTRPEEGEPRGGDSVWLYLWERESGRIRRLDQAAVVTQTRYGGGINRLDFGGPGKSSTRACIQSGSA